MSDQDISDEEMSDLEENRDESSGEESMDDDSDVHDDSQDDNAAQAGTSSQAGNAEEAGNEPQPGTSSQDANAPQAGTSKQAPKEAPKDYAFEIKDNPELIEPIFRDDHPIYFPFVNTHPLKEDNIRFGLEPAKGQFMIHEQMYNYHLKPRYHEYKKELADHKEWDKKFEKNILIVDRDDDFGAGLEDYRKYFNPVLEKYKDKISKLKPEDCTKIRDKMQYKGVFTKPEQFRDRFGTWDTLLPEIYKRGFSSYPMFLQSLYEVGHKDLHNAMWREETTPAKLVIDYDKLTITISPQDIEQNSQGLGWGYNVPANKTDDCYPLRKREKLPNQIVITGKMLRYAHLMPYPNRILLSYWPNVEGPDAREIQKNIWIKHDAWDGKKSIKFINAVRYLAYKHDNKTPWRAHMFKAELGAYVRTILKKEKGMKHDTPPPPPKTLDAPRGFEKLAKGKPTFKEFEKADQTYYALVDEEGLTLYDPKNHNDPVEYFKMHMEPTPNSLNLIYFYGIEGNVMQFEKKDCRLFIYLKQICSIYQKERYESVKLQLRVNIASKSKKTFDFDKSDENLKWLKEVSKRCDDYWVPGQGIIPFPGLEYPEDQTYRQSFNQWFYTPWNMDKEEVVSTQSGTNLTDVERGLLRDSRPEMEDEIRAVHKRREKLKADGDPTLTHNT